MEKQTKRSPPSDQPDRHLRWRLTKGQRWIDLVEVEVSPGVAAYVGLIDGRRMVTGDDRLVASRALIRAALGDLR